MTVSDFLTLLKEGGPLAVACFFLGWAFWQERKAHDTTRNNLRASEEARMIELKSLMGERLDDARRHAEQLDGNTRALDRAVAALDRR